MQRNGFKENVPPPAGRPAPREEGGLFSGLGAHDQERKKLQEERRREYNAKLTGVSCLSLSQYICLYYFF